MTAVDPIRYSRFWAGSPILFQFGRFDSFVSRAMAERLAQSMPRPQRTEFYDAGHAVNDPRAMIDRCAFLAKCIHSGLVRRWE
jgi:pimeloyl-ACP methyl ester carboxylesterase